MTNPIITTTSEYLDDGPATCLWIGDKCVDKVVGMDSLSILMFAAHKRALDAWVADDQA